MGKELTPIVREELAGKVRDLVLDALRPAERGTGVLLSGGVDSQLVLRALLELEREPVALSFRRAGRESRDWILAKETADEFHVPFVDVVLPADPETLEMYVRWAVPYGLRNKAGIECFWPRARAIQAAIEKGCPAIATGDGGDGYHVLSKKGMIHYRDTVEQMDAFRRWYFGRPDWSQVETIRRYARERGLPVYMPLDQVGLLELFTGLSWDEVNRPKQKILLREAFEIPDRIPKHTNLQLGDSGIAESFEQLTPEGAKSPVVLYNRLAREADAPALFDVTEEERDAHHAG